MFCHLGDIQVHYERYGKGKPVVMIHGFTPDYRLMEGCMEPVFAGREGYERIYLDLPGMGRTKGEEWIKGTDGMLDAVLRFIDAILPEQSFLLAGESYGGYLARGIVARIGERVDGLLTICSPIYAEHEQRILPEHTVLKRDDELIASLSEEEAVEFTSIAVVQDQYTLERMRKEITPGIKMADSAFLEKIQQNYAFSFPIDLTEPFVKPALFLTGRQDAVVGYKDHWEILDQFPRASFVVLDRAGHNLQIEQHAVFNALVDDWLSRADEAVNDSHRKTER
ncbi:Pimeloyl-ACP methyl ester carboxylesterase [Fictibacillus enclensis]|uniref:2-hydroxy-6-oxo-6-phenylhexa-2,4-dienoate hydrolase n=1 Tax=Fictibacillus enclensis TaxID=1017270 RepID=A0A0V8J7P1_9BACL|nr:alpha/beta hydrolase [Fictibacillus enclensis]KSU83053.1 2-hydroxy-6-oxo-6-phenylhexa-2,4-dienoate hydrolase [Fictibacillus enclensis]SCC09390.1 Pimeloyl-ACP methyl ester carboxylesterase [Fictibacillus enclensis]